MRRFGRLFQCVLPGKRKRVSASVNDKPKKISRLFSVHRSATASKNSIGLVSVLHQQKNESIW